MAQSAFDILWDAFFAEMSDGVALIVEGELRLNHAAEVYLRKRSPRCVRVIREALLAEGDAEARATDELGREAVSFRPFDLGGAGGGRGMLLLAAEPPPDCRRECRLYEKVFDSLNTAIMCCDSNLNIRFINKSYASFYGLDQNEVVGNSVKTYFPGITGAERVLARRKPETDTGYTWGGMTQVVSRHPIFEHGRVVGAVAEIPYKRVEDIDTILKRVRRLHVRVGELKADLKAAFAPAYTLSDIVGASREIEEARAAARRMASAELPVLIQGETGTGKELFAHAIHAGSPRSEGPLVIVNCSAVTAELFESEFFGYERGAFTGALAQGKRGKIEMARGGTLFLDEVGDLPVLAQAKLLRVLESHRFERVGGTEPIQPDFRLICATNRDLEQMVKAGSFRRDLFHRLAVLSLEIPPLRTRRSDIGVLIEHFIEKFKPYPWVHAGFARDALDTLLAYDWSGNVRQLRNVVSFALTHLTRSTEGPFIISRDLLPGYLREAASTPTHENGHFIPLPLSEAVACYEKSYLQRSLDYFRGNKARACKTLAISRQTLYEKLKRHQMGLH